MRNKFFFTLLVTILMVGQMWAVELDPAADYSYRLNWNSSSSTYNFQYKKHTDTNFANFEIKWASQYFAIQQYNIENYKYVKSMKLTIPHDNTLSGNTSAMAIWNFGKNELQTNSSKKETLLKAVQTVTGTNFYQNVEVPTAENNTANTPDNWGNSTFVATSYADNKWTANITVPAADAVTMDGTTGKIRLLITNNVPKASTAAKYADGSKLTVEYYAVYNETQSKGYDNLAAAVAAATEGDNIKVLADQTITQRLDIAKAITIDGNSKTLTINKFSATGVLVSAGATIKNLTVVANNEDKATFELSNTSTDFTANIENVTVKDAKVSNQGVYRIKNNATVTLKNIVHNNVTTTDGYGEIFVAAAAKAVSLRGANTIGSVYFEKDKRINVSGATFTSPVQLAFISTYQDPYVCIQQSKKLDDYTLADSNKELYVSKDTETQWEISVRTKAATALTYELTVTDAGMATLVLGFDVPTLPASVKAYTLTNNGSEEIVATELTAIEKNKPVLIVAEAATYTFTSEDGATKDEQANPVNGCLVGTYTDGTAVPASAAGAYNYILAKVGDEVGFYQVADASNKINAYRAYLSCSYNSNVSPAPMRIRFAGHTATDVENVSVEVKAEKFVQNGRLYIRKADRVYTIDGRLVK